MGSELRFGNILETDRGVVVGVGGHTEFHNDGICSEMGFGNEGSPLTSTPLSRE